MPQKVTENRVTWILIRVCLGLSIFDDHGNNFFLVSYDEHQTIIPPLNIYTFCVLV